MKIRILFFYIFHQKYQRMLNLEEAVLRTYFIRHKTVPWPVKIYIYAESFLVISCQQIPVAGKVYQLLVFFHNLWRYLLYSFNSTEKYKTFSKRSRRCVNSMIYKNIGVQLQLQILNINLYSMQTLFHFILFFDLTYF